MQNKMISLKQPNFLDEKFNKNQTHTDKTVIIRCKTKDV